MDNEDDKDDEVDDSSLKVFEEKVFIYLVDDDN
jgi:hypothetical protein